MCLYKSWVLGLSEDLKKIVVSKEEETGEDKSFLLEIVVQTFLNLVEFLIGFLEVLHDVFFFGKVNETWLLLNTFHGTFPEIIDLDEHFVFEGHRSCDITGTENGLKIHPVSLYFKDFFRKF